MLAALMVVGISKSVALREFEATEVFELKFAVESRIVATQEVVVKLRVDVKLTVVVQKIRTWRCCADYHLNGG